MKPFRAPFRFQKCIGEINLWFCLAEHFYALNPVDITIHFTKNRMRIPTEVKKFMHYKNSMVKIKQKKVRDFPRVIIPKPKSLNKICETPSAPSSLEIYGFGTGLGEKTI